MERCEKITELLLFRYFQSLCEVRSAFSQYWWGNKQTSFPSFGECKRQVMGDSKQSCERVVYVRPLKLITNVSAPEHYECFTNNSGLAHCYSKTTNGIENKFIKKKKGCARGVGSERVGERYGKFVLDNECQWRNKI